MAPEVKHAQNEGAYDGIKSDIFALGHILFITHTSMLLFTETSSSNKKFERLQKNPTKAVAKLVGHEDTDPDFIELISAMCKRDPAERPSLSEIRGHPWMT
jgi:serine/threonine protein kinase